MRLISSGRVFTQLYLASGHMADRPWGLISSGRILHSSIISGHMPMVIRLISSEHVLPTIEIASGNMTGVMRLISSGRFFPNYFPSGNMPVVMRLICSGRVLHSFHIPSGNQADAPFG